MANETKSPDRAERLAKHINTAGVILAVILLILGVILTIAGYGKLSPALRRISADAKNFVGLEEEITKQDLHIGSGQTVKIPIEPLSWTPQWIVIDGTFFSTKPTGEVHIKFSNGNLIKDKPGVIIDANYYAKVFVFRLYNPSPTERVIQEITVQ
ncbi:MAG: hypothetical protein WC519_01125 [Parcubacteria group bacterium]